MPIELQTIHTTTFLKMDTEVANMQERVSDYKHKYYFKTPFETKWRI